ncbi:LptA/OstA family protein [Roseospira visakhapatnamensis]|uniref:Lipopolysaccharide export system protein LptA n=1 Tax=Roseospira visakhapatnamensis TaxID=390880 RepID=A0A7W6WBF1_9PROT|nr:hypothetical protein [Roseospira visakhapatnamensis]MBB4267482.1 lipopolysaccharide export system protein LptA [Roseospira visakhapatnamensis]
MIPVPPGPSAPSGRAEAGRASRGVLPARAVFAVLAVALGLAGASAPAMAQTAALSEGGDAPIEVTSDEGIEWRRDEKLYIARGNAEAVQGDDRVYGDVLVAHYRETPEGATEVWRMEARGNARIVTPDQTVTGGVAIYEVDKDVLVVRGGDLRLKTPTEVVTAMESLEYWGAKRMAVARGDALARRANGDVIRADVLTGYFGEAAATDAPDAASSAAAGPAGATGDLERMEGFGEVMITTAKEVVRGDRAVYDVPAGIATVVGGVTISTETDQFAGERAVMNLNTGVSTLQGGAGDGRARALIAPSRPDVDDGAGDGRP